MLAQSVTFDWSVLFDNIPLFVDGLQLTVGIAVSAFVIATLLGIVVALARLSDNRLVSGLAAGWINVMRAIPLLVFIVFVYYGIAIFFELEFLSAIQAGMLAFSLQYSAWLGEIFRSGIQAVPHGQREAAMAMGMGRPRTFRSIILPQAARIALPPTGNMMVGMVKDSSLVYILGVPELFRNAQLLANRTFRYFEVYLAIVVTYLALTMAVHYGMKLLEGRMVQRDPLAAEPPAHAVLTRRRRAHLAALRDRVLADNPAPPPLTTPAGPSDSS